MKDAAAEVSIIVLLSDPITVCVGRPISRSRNGDAPACLLNGIPLFSEDYLFIFPDYLVDAESAAIVGLRFEAGLGDDEGGPARDVLNRLLNMTESPVTEHGFDLSGDVMFLDVTWSRPAEIREEVGNVHYGSWVFLYKREELAKEFRAPTAMLIRDSSDLDYAVYVPPQALSFEQAGITIPDSE